MKSVLELDHKEARKFFLKEESYCSIELPEYFTFQSLLNNLSNAINHSPLSKNQLKSAKQITDINYTLYYNKDGKYAWRPLQLINPVIYVYLVHKITEKNNWKFITERFKKFQENQKIKCCSIPIISEQKNKSDKANTVINWWNKIELQSLELALNWNCFLNTDITDCYNSIYTHTIPWALHDKDKIKSNIFEEQKSKKKFVGDDIDETIKCMQYAQTNGIPQGSILMDFIAEMVLGYADMLLSEKIKTEQYQILRYRDDYRIFVNNQEDAIQIVKLLTEILIDLNLQLNPQKTFLSNDIIQDAIKPDKLYWIGAKKGAKTLQKTLLLVHCLAKKYPNSGSLKRALSDFQKKLYKEKSIDKENVRVLISIIVDIAYKNPKTYPITTTILSKLLFFLNNNTDIIATVSAIEQRFKRIPNVGHLMVWLQRLTLKIDKEKIYEEKLCGKVTDNNIAIWDIDWLDDKIKKIVTDAKIIDNDYIENMNSIIKPEEVQLFNSEY